MQFILFEHYAWQSSAGFMPVKAVSLCSLQFMIISDVAKPQHYQECIQYVIA